MHVSSDVNTLFTRLRTCLERPNDDHYGVRALNRDFPYLIELFWDVMKRLDSETTPRLSSHIIRKVFTRLPPSLRESLLVSTTHKFSLLHHLAFLGHVTALRLLLKIVTNNEFTILVGQDDFGCTPLHYAIETKHYGVIRELLKSLSNSAALVIALSVQDRKGVTPFECLVSNREFLLINEIFKKLSHQQRRDLMATSSTALYRTIFHGAHHVDLFTLLLPYATAQQRDDLLDPFNWGKTLLHYAAAKQDYALVEAILQGATGDELFHMTLEDCHGHSFLDLMIPCENTNTN